MVDDRYEKEQRDLIQRIRKQRDFVKWFGIIMWAIIILASIAPLLIASIMDFEINKLFVLVMFTTLLLALLGGLHFLLKNLATIELRLFDLNLIQAANDPKMNSGVRACLLSKNTDTPFSNNPVINLDSESITVISDAIASRIAELIKRKRANSLNDSVTFLR